MDPNYHNDNVWRAHFLRAQYERLNRHNQTQTQIQPYNFNNYAQRHKQRMQQQPNPLPSLSLSPCTTLATTKQQSNNTYNNNGVPYNLNGLIPDKNVEVTWQAKTKKNNKHVLRRIKKKVWTYKVISYEPHPSRPYDKLLKRIRTYRRTTTRRDTAKGLTPILFPPAPCFASCPLFSQSNNIEQEPL